MKLLIQGLVALAVISTATIASASGDLYVGTIKRIELSADSSPVSAWYFTIVTNSGTGPCGTDGTAIRFPTNAVNAAMVDNLLSLALAAQLSGKPVRIHTYETGTDCEKAQYIRIDQ